MTAAQLFVELETTCWAIAPARLEALRTLALNEATRQAGRPGLPAPRSTASKLERAGGVQILRLVGYSQARQGFLSMIGRGFSTDEAARRIRQAARDPEVQTILLEIDCAGGEVYGAGELASEILEARRAKPIVAVANSCASGTGYWIASCATELYATPGGEIGGIGLAQMHFDESRALAKAGVGVTLISAGRYKTEGHPFGPLPADAQAFMQSRVDAYSKAFTNAVARGRRMSIDDVRRHMGQGRSLGAADALKRRMVDGIKTFDEVLWEKSGGRAGNSARLGPSAKRATRQLALIEDLARLMH